MSRRQNVTRNRQNRKNRRPRPQRRRNVNSRENNEYQLLTHTSIPRSLMHNSPFPPQMVTKLLYYEPNLSIQPGSVAFFVRDWRMNSAYDPDPAVGGGSLAGFTQLAAIYNIYQVINFRFRFEVSTQEAAQSLQFGFTFKDWQPSSIITTYAEAQDALELAPTTGPHMVGVISGNSVYRSRWYSLHPGDVVGNKLLYMSTAAYSSVVTTNPSSIVWASLVLISDTSAGTIPNGIVLNMFMELTTRFYSQSSTLV